MAQDTSAAARIAESPQSTRSVQGSKDAETSEAIARVVRAQGGDRQAFQDLVETYQRPLYYTVMRWLNHAPDASDLVQRTWIKAFQELSKLREPAAFKGWLFRIALNLTRNHVRDQTRRKAEPLEEAFDVGVEATAERHLESRRAVRVVYSAVETLSPKQREVLRLRVDAGLNYRDIAVSVGSTEGAVRVHFHNAVKKLREALKNHEG